MMHSTRGKLPLIALTAGLVLLALFPDAAHACPVCFSATDENREAFLATTVFLSVFPLGMVAGVGLWVRKRSKELDEQDGSAVREDAE